MRAIAVAFLASTLAAVPALAETFKVGAWVGQPFYSGEGGAFSNCAMWADYETGDSLIFSITDDGALLLGISNDNWRLGKGDSYSVALHVDRRKIGSHKAVASSETDVYIDLPYSDQLIRLLRKGRVLYVQTRQQTLSFKLTGTNAALTRLQDCVYRELFAGRSARNPFTGGSAAGGNPFGDDSQRSARRDDGERSAARGEITADDRRVIRAMLDKAGLYDFEHLGPDELARWAPDAVLGWIGNRVVGLMYSYDDLDFEIGLATSIIIATFEKECDGRFTYAVSKADFANGKPARRAVTKCSGATKESAIGLIVMRQEYGTVAIAHVGLIEDETEVARTHEAIYNAISGY